MSAIQRADRDVHGLGGGHVLVDEATDERSEAHGVTGDDASEGARNRGSRPAVIDPVGRGESAERERQRRDVGGHARGLDQEVVGRVGTDDGVTRNHDRLAIGHIGVGEETRGASGDEHRVVAEERVDDASRQERGPRLVVDLVEGRDAGDRERRDGDVRQDVRRLDEAIIGRIGTGEREAEEADGLAVADVLIGERRRRRRAIHADGVISEARDRATREGRGVGAVVGLVLGRDARDRPGQRSDRQRTDDGGRAGEVAATDRQSGRGGGVIPDAQITAGAGDGIGRPKGEVDRTAGAVGILEGVTRATDRRQSREDLAACRQVFNTADGESRRRAVGGRPVAGADEELASGDDREVAADIVHRVILGTQAGSLEDARINTRRLRRGVAARDDQRTAHDRGGVRPDEAGVADAVEVRAVGTRNEFRVRIRDDGQRRLGDGRGQSARLDQGVIGRTRAREAITRHRDGLVGRGVGIAEDRQGGSGDDRGIPSAGDRRDHRRAREAGADRGIIDATHRRHTRDRHGERGDTSRGGLARTKHVIAREPSTVGQLNRTGGHQVGTGDVLGVEGGGEGLAQDIGANEAHERE